MFLKDSKKYPNYAATVRVVDSIIEIEGMDRLAYAVLGVEKVLVSKDDIHKGDIVVFVPQETVLSNKYLKANNLYTNYELNDNYNEYLSVKSNDFYTDEEKERIYKGMRGYFKDNGRVTLLKIKGMYSPGFVASTYSMEKAYTELRGIDWNDYIDTSFDMVGDDIFVKKYFIDKPFNNEHKSKKSKIQDNHYKKKLALGVFATLAFFVASVLSIKMSNVSFVVGLIASLAFILGYIYSLSYTVYLVIQHKKDRGSFDYLIPQYFPAHYNTSQLRDTIQYLEPEDRVDITVKIHGTSCFMGYVKCNRKLSLFERIKKRLGLKVCDTIYRRLYSTRNVVQNRYDDQDNIVNSPYTEVFELIKHHITLDMIVYGEIFGYMPGSSTTYIQKNHDYGCDPGKYKFMPYRITTINSDGYRKEWDIDEVIEWTNNVITMLPFDKKEYVMPLKRVYSGPLMALSTFNIAEGVRREDALKEWRKALYSELQKPETFGLELKEPLCKNNVPREGIVIRKIEDIVPRAFKLKSNAHYDLAKKSHDNGEVDIEEDQENS